MGGRAFNQVVTDELTIEARAVGRLGKSRESGVGARGNTCTNAAAGAGSTRGGTARTSRNGGRSAVSEVVLGNGRGHAREGQDGGGRDGSEGRHFDFLVLVVVVN